MGIESLLQQNVLNAGLAGTDRLARNAMFPQSQMDKTQYAVPSQMPTSAETIRSDYDAPTNAYTGLPLQPFAKGGIASIPRFYDGGIGSTGVDNTEAKKATVADLYQKILGREAKPEETGQWIDYLDVENPNQGVMNLADRLAQSEEGIAYGKSNPKDVYKAMVGLSQADSPFAGMDTPYSNMRYLSTSNRTNYGGETTPDSVTTTHMFQDENGGVITTDQFGQPIEYSPGRDWYQEQYKKHPDALRNYGYRNQTYLAAGPLEQTYKFNGYDVPIKAGEYQVDPKTGELITGKTGDYKPLELKPAEYDWFNDWGGPAMVVAIPALAAAGAAAAGAYGAGAAGTAAGGAAAAEGAGAGLTTAEMMGGAGGAFTPAAGSGASFAIEPGAAYTVAEGAGTASQGFGLKDAYDVYKNVNRAKTALNMLNNLSVASGQGGYGLTGASGNYGYSPYVPFTPNVASGAGVTGLTGIGSGTSGTNPFAVQYAIPKIQLSRLSDFDGYATGGITTLGGYSDGGRLLKGPGDGMSDNIPATIANKQPARLADGEFVIPADVVSHLGNGSTDAGAKQLYKMMDKIRKARTGTKKQGKQINPDKYLP